MNIIAIRKALMIAGILLVSVISFIFIVFLISSPGRVPGFNKENSISERVFTEINGSNQGMIIKGEDKSNPVILFLHGGPGMPEFFLADEYFSELYKHFTICFWEQRGAGISYIDSVSMESITASKLVEDSISVTHYLQKRFNRDKIILLGHSWGTYIGIKAIEKSPDLYSSYLSVAQIVNSRLSEQMAYDYIEKRLEDDERIGDLDKLRAFIDGETGALDVEKFKKSSFRDYIMHNLSIGTMKDMNSVVSGIFFAYLKCRAYTVKEKVNVWIAKSKLISQSSLRDEMLSTDFSKEIKALEVPVYFFCGSSDYTVNHKLSKEYFDLLEAPLKKFYLFDDSAHSPLFEEKEKFLNILLNEIQHY